MEYSGVGGREKLVMRIGYSVGNDFVAFRLQEACRCWFGSWWVTNKCTGAEGATAAGSGAAE